MTRLILILALLTPIRAWAGVCDLPPPSRSVVPADGAEGVPTDATLRVFLRGFPAELRARMAAEYRLVGPKGPVPLRASVVLTRLDLVPAALKPNTQYQLEALFAYDHDGVRVDDPARLVLAPQAKRLWYPVSRFRTAPTGSSRAHLSPPVLDTLRGNPSGGVVSAKWHGYAVDPLEIVELEVEGYGVVRTAPPRVDRAQRISVRMLCASEPISVRHPPGSKWRYRARVILRDASGGTRASNWLRRTLMVGEPPTPPAAITWAGGWFDAPAAEPKGPRRGAGPAGCVHGLEVRESRTLAEGRIQLGELAAEVKGGVVGLVIHDHQAWFVGAGPMAIAPARWAKGVPAHGGTLFLINGRRRHDLTVLRLNGQGEPIWRRRLEVTQRRSWHSLGWGRIAACGHRVVATWLDQWAIVDGQRTGRARSHWVTLDEATGEVLHQGYGEDSVHYEVGCLGQDPLLMGRRGGTHLDLRILRSGVAQPLHSLPKGRPFAALARDRGATLGFVRQGIIFAQRLDPQGTPVGTPVRLGQGKTPVMASFKANYVMAWASPKRHESIKVTVFSGDGRLAEPLSIPQTWRPALYTFGDKVWLVAKQNHNKLRAFTLGCRRRSGPGGPPRISW